MTMRNLRQRLDDLIRQPRALPTVRRSSGRTAAGLAELVGGLPTRINDHAYWQIDTPFVDICACQTAIDHQLDADGAFGVERGMVVDIETGGFSGTPVFLIGVVLLDQRPLCVRQLLARDYPEEVSILCALAELAAGRDTWITFNGRSFDEPFLRDRATLHRVDLPPVQMHIDVLHAARRAWRGQLPNFRLGTLEECILKRPRVGDIPSSDVPELFHHFIRTGNAGPLRGVLEHNRIDLVSSTELFVRLSCSMG